MKYSRGIACVLQLSLTILLSCRESKNPSQIQADSLFNQQLAIVESAVLDSARVVGEHNYHIFSDAVDFLETTSRIDSHRDGTYAGPIYRDHESIKEDYQHWKTWFDSNRKRLRW